MFERKPMLGSIPMEVLCDLYPRLLFPPIVRVGLLERALLVHAERAFRPFTNTIG